MTPRAAAPALAVLSVLLAGALVGCSGGSSGGDGGSTAADASVVGGAPAAELQDSAGGAADSVSAVGRDRAETGPGVPAQAVIRHGNVALRADDVADVQQEVQKVVDRYAGQVTEEKTTTDDDGKPAYTRMVLRIPSERFSDTMDALQGVDGAELESANSTEDDVTTKLIDTRTRVAAQKRSIARITVLFDRAESIRDIMAIESELSQRQADLDSLERQLAYLESQTSLSTITVSIDENPAPAPATEDGSGFVAGLSAGWDALAAFAVALATGFGAVLPWLVAALVLGPPAYLLVRAVRRRLSSRRTGRTPSAA
ncbi:DUF4349 domain-containing protein [Nocardioides sp.]|uniref:DUF4349 domain-containing protein n=1 Tax=Nocardioides sp. TaxID=35761 RepID=UPI003782F735